MGLSGESERARQLLAELEQRSHERYVSPFKLMLVHLGLGEREEAFTWLLRTTFEVLLPRRAAVTPAQESR